MHEDNNVGMSIDIPFIKGLDSSWFKHYLEAINREFRDNDLKILRTLDPIEIKVMETEDMIDILEGMGTLFWRDTIMIIMEQGVIRAEMRKKGKYMAMTFTIAAKDLAAFHAIKDMVQERVRPYSYDQAGAFIQFHWYYVNNREMLEKVKLSESISEKVFAESYPYLPGLDDYIQEYLDSDASILLLIGQPGTGKTRLIRHILREMSYRKEESPNIIYASEKNVIQKSKIFMDFMESWCDGLVLEDIDYDLMDRKEGNFLMYKLLTSSDGIISSLGKKMILSTNLPTIKDIDPALLRPGRCFDIIHTRALSRVEIVNLSEKLNLETIPELNSCTLAEFYKAIYNTQARNLNHDIQSVRQSGFTANLKHYPGLV